MSSTLLSYTPADRKMKCTWQMDVLMVIEQREAEEILEKAAHKVRMHYICVCIYTPVGLTGVCKRERTEMHGLHAIAP